MILSALLSLALVSDSLTISPLSFTYHNFDDASVEAFYKYTIGKNTTIHPGAHLRYDTDGYFQAAGWYFLDSYGRHAGGLTVGPKFDLWWFKFGAVAGLYARQHDKRNPMKFPFTWRMGEAAIAPFAGITGSVTIPMTEHLGIETGCLSNWFITNCSVGLNVRW